MVVNIITRKNLVDRLVDLLGGDGLSVKREIAILLKNITKNGVPQDLVAFYLHYKIM